MKEIITNLIAQNLSTNYYIALGLGIAVMIGCLVMMAYGLYLIVFGGNE